MISMKNFCDLADFSVQEIESLITQARSFEKSPSDLPLKGKVLALLFLNPSLRTLTSFQATMTRLGGGAYVISPEMSIHGLETQSGIAMDGTAAEHIRDAIPVIASYADAIGIRAVARRNSLESDLQDRDFNEYRSLCDIPVLNLESSTRHPCQSLADWKTLDDFEVPKRGGKFVFSWVYHPDALPLAIPGDTIHMAAIRGMDVTVLRPDGFALPDALLDRARAGAAVSGGSVRETNDRKEAFEGADVVYAGSWCSMEFYDNLVEDRKCREANMDWCISEPWFEGVASRQCLFMHALPVRRGVEVEDEILDGPRSIVVRQAQNRMFTQMSVLKNLLHDKDSIN